MKNRKLSPNSVEIIARFSHGKTVISIRFPAWLLVTLISAVIRKVCG